MGKGESKSWFEGMVKATYSTNSTANSSDGIIDSGPDGVEETHAREKGMGSRCVDGFEREGNEVVEAWLFGRDRTWDVR